MGRITVLKINDWLDRQFDVVKRDKAGKIIEVKRRTDGTVFCIRKYLSEDERTLNTKMR